jgi:hypothetical protein
MLLRVSVTYRCLSQNIVVVNMSKTKSMPRTCLDLHLGQHALGSAVTHARSDVAFTKSQRLTCIVHFSQPMLGCMLSLEPFFVRRFEILSPNNWHLVNIGIGLNQYQFSQLLVLSLVLRHAYSRWFC